MKVRLELNFINPNQVWLNFWDHVSGHDICVRIPDNDDMILMDLDRKKISLQEFLHSVKRVAESWEERKP